jgi:hypothetical protein
VTENYLDEQVEPISNLVNLNNLEISISTLQSEDDEINEVYRVDFSTLPNLSNITLSGDNYTNLTWPHTAWEGELQSSHTLTVYGRMLEISDRRFFTPFLSHLRSLYMHGVVQKKTTNNSELIFHNHKTLELIHCDIYVLKGALFPTLRHLFIALPDQGQSEGFGLSNYRYWMSGLSTLILRGPESNLQETYLEEISGEEQLLITNAINLEYLYICNIGSLATLDGFLAKVRDKLQASFVAEKDSDTVHQPQPHFGSWQDAMTIQELPYLRYGCQGWDKSFFECGGHWRDR